MNNNIKVIQWLSQYSDLNPTENLWSELIRDVGKHVCSNKAQFWDIVQKSWFQIPVGTCRKLISSMPNRIREFLKIKGGNICYYMHFWNYCTKLQFHIKMHALPLHFDTHTYFFDQPKINYFFLAFVFLSHSLPTLNGFLSFVINNFVYFMKNLVC